MRSQKLTPTQQAADMVANTITREFIASHPASTFSENEMNSLNETVKIMAKHGSASNSTSLTHCIDVPCFDRSSPYPTNHNRRMIQIALEGYTVTRVLQLSFFDNSHPAVKPIPRLSVNVHEIDDLDSLSNGTLLKEQYIFNRRVTAEYNLLRLLPSIYIEDKSISDAGGVEINKRAKLIDTPTLLNWIDNGLDHTYSDDVNDYINNVSRIIEE